MKHIFQALEMLGVALRYVLMEILGCWLLAFRNRKSRIMISWLGFKGGTTQNQKILKCRL